jgi:hypothetical protein
MKVMDQASPANDYMSSTRRGVRNDVFAQRGGGGDLKSILWGSRLRVLQEANKRSVETNE